MLPKNTYATIQPRISNLPDEIRIPTKEQKLGNISYQNHPDNSAVNAKIPLYGNTNSHSQLLKRPIDMSGFNYRSSDISNSNLNQAQKVHDLDITERQQIVTETIWEQTQKNSGQISSHNQNHQPHSPSSSVTEIKRHGNLGKRMKKIRRLANEIPKPFACNFKDCAKSFGTVTNLNLHIRLKKHGEMRSIKEFKDEVVKVQFASPSSKVPQYVKKGESINTVESSEKFDAFLLANLRFGNNPKKDDKTINSLTNDALLLTNLLSKGSSIIQAETPITPLNSRTAVSLNATTSNASSVIITDADTHSTQSNPPTPKKNVPAFKELRPISSDNLTVDGLPSLTELKLSILKRPFISQ